MSPKQLGKGDPVIAEARIEHQEIIRKLMTGPGDSEGAMYRAERMFGLSYWCQWNLRYKSRATGAFVERLHQAYFMMLETSVKRDLEKLKTEKLRGEDDASLQGLISEAEALLAKISARRVKV